MLLAVGCGGADDSSAAGERDLRGFQVVAANDRIHVVGIATKGDQNSSNGCQENESVRELAVAHLDAQGRLRGETSVPEGRIEGCATWVDRTMLDDEGRIVLDGSFDRWPGFFPGGDGGPESARIVARIERDGGLDDSLDGDGIVVDPTHEDLPPGLPDVELARVEAPGGGWVSLEEDDPYVGGAHLTRHFNDNRRPQFRARVAGIPRTAAFELGGPWVLATHPRVGIVGFGRFFRAEESGDVVNLVFRHRLSDGKPDRRFGVRGALEPRPPGAKYWSAYDLALQRDGRVLVAGVVERKGRANLFAGRFTPAGKADPSFGRDGFVELDVGRSTSGDDRDWRAAVALTERGTIVLCSWIVGQGTTVVRLLPNGDLDRSFGRGGRVRVPRV